MRKGIPLSAAIILLAAGRIRSFDRHRLEADGYDKQARVAGFALHGGVGFQPMPRVGKTTTIGECMHFDRAFAPSPKSPYTVAYAQRAQTDPRSEADHARYASRNSNSATF